MSKCKLKMEDEEVIESIYYKQKLESNISGLQAKKFTQSINDLFQHYNQVIAYNLK